MQQYKKWIWEHEKYGTFPFDRHKMDRLISDIKEAKKKMDIILTFYGEGVVSEVEVENLTEEIYDNSRIEGEHLQREAIRNSVAKAINVRYAQLHNTSTKHTDKLVDFLMDSRRNQKPLSMSRLHKWHKAVFAHTRTNQNRKEEDKIKIGKFRDDEVRVIEKSFGRGGDLTRYLAPPPETVEKDIVNFLDYCNNSEEDPYIKAAIAHLWFVSIHPYDDGNGRVSRAFADHILAHDSNEKYKAYSISSGIMMNERSYYDILSETTHLYKNRSFDFTPWIEWHLKCNLDALKRSLKDIGFIIDRAIFWETAQFVNLNERKSKTLNSLLDKLSKGKEAVISRKDYIKENQTTAITAGRDIKDLVNSNILQRVEGKGGRSTMYALRIGGKSTNSIPRSPRSLEMEKKMTSPEAVKSIQDTLVKKKTLIPSLLNEEVDESYRGGPSNR